MGKGAAYAWRALRRVAPLLEKGLAGRASEFQFVLRHTRARWLVATLGTTTTHTLVEVLRATHALDRSCAVPSEDEGSGKEMMFSFGAPPILFLFGPSRSGFHRTFSPPPLTLLWPREKGRDRKQEEEKILTLPSSISFHLSFGKSSIPFFHVVSPPLLSRLVANLRGTSPPPSKQTQCYLCVNPLFNIIFYRVPT